MVLYFSGTGNSKFAAQTIADRLYDEVVSLNTIVKENRSVDFHSDKPYIFVFPSYASRPPMLVVRHIEAHINFSGNQKAYFVMTAGGNIGGLSPLIFKRLCQKKDLIYQGLAGISMPRSHVAMYNVADAEEGKLQVQNAIPTMNEIANQIGSGKVLIPDKRMTSMALVRYLFGPTYLRLVCHTKGFWVTDKCIGCGKCAKNCTVNAISMVGKKPVWKDMTCLHCMSCISGCPKRAIEYKDKTQNRNRYYCNVKISKSANE